MLGMGTILSSWFTEKLPKDRLKIVLGSGGGKEGGAPQLDSNWRIYGVRGPLTASYSNLPQEMVLTDPAALVRDMHEFRPSVSRRGIGFMPHIWSMDQWDWRSLCDELGLIYVDPRANSKETIRQIWSLECLLTEAMHGAIVGDALRTPWIALQISPNFEPSKWCDWAGSLGMPMYFHSVPDLYAPQGSLKNAAKSIAKSVLATAGMRAYPRPKTRRWEVDYAKRRLRSLMREVRPQLSEEARLDEAIERTYNALEKLKVDYASGVLHRA